MSQHEEDLVFAEVPAYRRFISKHADKYSVFIFTETSLYTPEQLEEHEYFVCWIDEEWQHHTISINPAAN